MTASKIAPASRRHSRIVPVRGHDTPAPLPAPVKRGMALICQLLHGAMSSAGGGAPAPEESYAPPSPPPPAPAGMTQQQRHNMNGHAFIKVIGAGGGGGNAIARMIDGGLQVRSAW